MANTAQAQSSEFAFSHSSLGFLTGIVRTPTVVQFRSIPYARIPIRFRQSIPVEFLHSQERQCTNFGASCPAPRQSLDEYGGPLPDENDIVFDEQTCLNLTVTAPRGVLEAMEAGGEGVRAEVPVMVHVHGGALSSGTHISSVSDTHRMVEQSISDGTPVIIVAINYRVNFLGFLACQDLLDDAVLTKTPPFNFGLHDQRTAFFWIQKHISGFGGSSSNITAFGESAGSASLSLHMCSNTEPLFKRAVLQSGTAATAPMETKLKVKEQEYRHLLVCCGIDPQVGDRLDRLREVPVKRIVDAVGKTGIAIFKPFAEGVLFPVVPDYFTQVELFEKCDWITDVIIGDTLYEGYLFQAALKYVKLDHLMYHFEQTLGIGDASKILSAYSIDRGLDRNLFWTRLNTLVGDLLFSQPIHVLARSLAANQHKQQQLQDSEPGTRTIPKKIYRYNLTLRNPFPGSAYYGVAGHHSVEMLFQFQTLLSRLPTLRLREISKDFCQRLIRFAAGKSPWDEYEVKEQKIAVVGEREGWEVRSRQEDLRSEPEEGRRYVAWEIVEKIWDGLDKGKREDIVGRLVWLDALRGLANATEVSSEKGGDTR